MRIQSQHLLWLALFTSLGFLLRLWGSRGDLWLDEIYSLHLISDLNSPLEIFYKVLHDNNHPLNSLYLYYTHHSTSSVLLRGLSIVLGTASIPAAYWAARPAGDRTALVLSLCIAVSYTLVNYGSEARGYGGLILCMLLSIGLALRSLHDPDPARYRLTMGLVLWLGTLFNLTLFLGGFALAVWLVWARFRIDPNSLGHSLDRTVTLFGFALLVPVFWGLMLAVSWALAPDPQISMGGITPFSFTDFASGLGNLYRYTLGLPEGPSGLTLLLSGTLLIGLSVALTPASDLHLNHLVLVFAVLLPLLMALARLPNLSMSRYFLFTGLILLFWFSHVFSSALDKPGLHRRLALFILLGTGSGNAHHLARFFTLERGQPQALVTHMTQSGPALYMTDNPIRTRIVTDYYSQNSPLSTVVPMINLNAATCSDMPNWYLRDHQPQPEDTPFIMLGPKTCQTRYELVLTSHSYGLSGLNFALYEKADADGSGGTTPNGILPLRKQRL